MSFARAAVTTLVVGLLTLGCGGEEDEPPAQLSDEERYCMAYRDFFDERAAHNMETSDSEVVATLKKWGRSLDENGAPDDMPAAAKAGHRIWSDLIGEVNDDANQADVVALESELTDKQLAQVEQFFAFNDATCLGSQGSVSPEEAQETTP